MAMNILGTSRYNGIFLDAARSLLRCQLDAPAVDKGACRLLLEVMGSVGISPRTEKRRRDELRQLLSGSLADQAVVQSTVEYILSQMVVKPRGKLAECLAVDSCRDYLSSAFSGMDVEIRRDLRCHRVLRNGSFSTDWRQAADLLFCIKPMDGLRAEGLRSKNRPKNDDLVVVGIAEVKSYSGISAGRLRDQLARNLLRLAGGVMVPKLFGQEEHTFRPDQIWFMTCDSAGASLIRAEDLVAEPAIQDILGKVCHITVGPPSRTKTGTTPFDLEIPLIQDELEDIGTEVAYYTIGALADQPDIDLSWWEWSANLRKALTAKGIELTKRQRQRRLRVLDHLDDNG